MRSSSRGDHSLLMQVQIGLGSRRKFFVMSMISESSLVSRNCSSGTMSSRAVRQVTSDVKGTRARCNRC